MPKPGTRRQQRTGPVGEGFRIYGFGILSKGVWRILKVSSHLQSDDSACSVTEVAEQRVFARPALWKEATERGCRRRKLALLPPLRWQNPRYAGDQIWRSMGSRWFVDLSGSCFLRLNRLCLTPI